MVARANHRRRYKMSTAAAVSGLLIAALAMLAMSVVVRADNFGTGPPATGWIADNGAHSYCRASGLDADLHGLLDDVMVYSLEGATDMTRHLEACQLSTDVWVYDADLPPGVRGQYGCNSGYLIGNVCSTASVTIDPALIRVGDFDNDDIKKTFCHEIGHSVGLTHGDFMTDCMINDEIPEPTGQWKHYNTHHKGHINAQY